MLGLDGGLTLCTHLWFDYHDDVLKLIFKTCTQIPPEEDPLELGS